ncbi:MAG: transglutaminase family protein, partial [Sphingobacteriales bacterium]
MIINVQSTLQYQAEAQCSVILNICALQPQWESILCNPTHHLVRDPSFNNHRLLQLNVADAGTFDLIYTATVSPLHRLIDCSNIQALEVPPFHPDVMPFLYPSRYCPSDRLTGFAETRFLKYANAFERVLAITDWIHEHVTYVSGSTDSSTDAADVILQQQGVCRDFAHIGITLCRALNIPARYCSAYAYQLEPQDFHACFEAFIGTEWIVFDATRLAPLNGLVKISHGRDAADTAVASLYGNVAGTYMEVSVTCDDAAFEPFFYTAGKLEG